jgi:hypothetical protein
VRSDVGALGYAVLATAFERVVFRKHPRALCEPPTRFRRHACSRTSPGKRYPLTLRKYAPQGRKTRHENDRTLIRGLPME